MKRRQRLNAVDLMLILLLTMSLLSCLLRFFYVDTESDAATLSTYRMVLRFEGVDAALADCCRVGEAAGISFDERNGVVASVQVQPTKQTVLANGASYEAEWELTRKCTLLVSIDVQALVKDGVLYLDGRHAKALAERVTLCTDRTRMTGVLYGYAPVTNATEAEKDNKTG